MRFGLISLIFLSCIACARLQNTAEQKTKTTATTEQEPQTTAALKPPVADHETPIVRPTVECSDGTVSTSQNDCLVSMSNKRLPPSRQVERSPIKPTVETIEMPAIR